MKFLFDQSADFRLIPHLREALHSKSELRAQLRILEYLRCNKLVQNRLIVQSPFASLAMTLRPFLAIMLLVLPMRMSWPSPGRNDGFWWSPTAISAS